MREFALPPHVGFQEAARVPASPMCLPTCTFFHRRHFFPTDPVSVRRTEFPSVSSPRELGWLTLNDVTAMPSAVG